MKIKFTKMQGTGNDMVMINNLDGAIELQAEEVVKICDRRFGVGADGLILLERRAGEGECFMNYFNSDGTMVEMCGNGIRCAAGFYCEQTGFEGDALEVGSRDGVKRIEIVGKEMFTVNMGQPEFESEDFIAGNGGMPRVELEGLELHCVSMGNPHAVTFMDRIDDFKLETVGPHIECADCFPNKINFEIVERLGDGNLKMRVWERGCGITLACGTGACAVYVVAKELGYVSGETRVGLPGGDLWIDQNEAGEVLMKGPAKIVYQGEIEI